MLSVHEVERTTGVTVRALHHYDAIGLLKPARSGDAGYRQYGEAELIRLQQIMFFRELGFSLKDIKRILDSPSYDEREALEHQRELLALERERITKLIDLIDNRKEGNTDMSFDGFKKDELESKKDEYRAEVIERWGDTKEFKQSEEKARAKGNADRGMEEANAIFDEFAALAGRDPADAEVQSLVKKWQAHITKHYYDCSDEVLKGLGQMYTADERFKANLDSHGAGTAELMSAAIAVYTSVK